MNKNFFKKIRILDGGMGQELLARGVKGNKTLWSANALLQNEYHQLILDTHLDFINSGAEVIVTNTFATRRLRLKENKIATQVKIADSSHNLSKAHLLDEIHQEKLRTKYIKVLNELGEDGMSCEIPLVYSEPEEKWILKNP